MTDLKRLFDFLRNALAAEQKHLSVWYVVFFILGTALYFGLPGEPSAPFLWIALAAAGGLYWFLRRHFWTRWGVLCLLFFLLGMTAGSLHTLQIHTITLEKPLYDVALSGTVSESALLLDRQRFVLESVRFDEEPALMPPHRVRLTLAGTEPLLSVGDKVRLRARLNPPQLPAEPHAYNAARAHWYRRIGGTGFVLELQAHEKQAAGGFNASLERLRQAISLRVRAVLPEKTAAVAIPLIIGEQGTVPPETIELYRRAGIMHVLSVSGFHLSLLAAFVFLVVRGFLSLFPWIALRWHTKKIAAVIALLFALFYLLISGLQVPAIRSFVMIAIVLTAVLFDRNALSVRSLAIACLGVLLVRPEMLLSVSFQLSFMAVLVLVSLYENLFRRFAKPARRSFWRSLRNLLIGFVIVDFLATLATTPYVIYHFNQYALYSLPGNVFAGILFSFWIMPLLLIAVLLMPLGGDALFLHAAGRGIGGVHRICEAISSLPYADMIFPAYPRAALLLMTLGLLSVCLFRTRLKAVGALFIAAGILMALLAPRPDLLVGDRGDLIAARAETGELHFLRADGSAFVRAIWQRRAGEHPHPPDTPPPLPRRIWIKDYQIAFSPELCEQADIAILADWNESYGCPQPVFTRRDIMRAGTVAVFFRPRGIHFETSRGAAGNRPWNKPAN